MASYSLRPENSWDFQERYRICKFYRAFISLVRRRNKCRTITCFRSTTWPF